MENKEFSKEECDAYLATVAEIKPWDSGDGETIDAWFSKTDGSYITFASLSPDIDWMVELSLSDLQSTRPEGSGVVQIGFHAATNTWYGWSHRARYNFGVGSKCKKGDAGYKGRNEEEVVEACVRFWSDDYVQDVAGLFTENDKGEKGVQLTGIYSETVSNEKLRGTVWEQFHHFWESGFGKGEWTAETMEDAKQMAINFARSVS